MLVRTAFPSAPPHPNALSMSDGMTDGAVLDTARAGQFLFLRFEDLMRMKAPALLTMLSNFTGLHTDPKIIEEVRPKCEAGRARKVPLSFTRKGNDSEARSSRNGLAVAIPALEKFYEPYDRWLQTLVHPAFQWGPETHKVH